MRSPSNSHYRRWEVRAIKSFWRRKWIILVCLLGCLTLVLVLALYSSAAPVSVERDTYFDDVPEGLYQEVLRHWYYFTDEKWYNKENVSMKNQVLLQELREKWIVWEHSPNESYFLQEPEIEDPSMGQASVVRSIFNNKENGFFIECGAYDGETRSNTLVLERFYGWTGILIEADPINFTKMLQKNRKAFLSPTCLSIKSQPTIASFIMARNVGRLHDPLNSTEKLPTNSPDVAHTGVHINVQCFPLAAYIFALNVTTVDYFSLDIEGNEVEVLETIPFDKVDIKALSVEYIHNSRSRKYLIDLMEARGYYVHSFVERDNNLANDIIFVKRDLELAKR